MNQIIEHITKKCKKCPNKKFSIDIRREKGLCVIVCTECGYTERHKIGRKKSG